MSSVARRAKQAVARLPGVSHVARNRAHARKARAEPVAPPVCASVLEWAVEHPGTRYWRIDAPTRVVKEPPRTVEPEVHWKFLQATEIPVAEKYVVELEGALLELPGPPHGGGPRHWAVVLRDGPRVILPDGRVATESTQGLVKNCLPYDADAATFMVGDYFSLVSPHSWEGNYGHWIHDMLTSLYGVTEHLPPDTRYIVPRDLQPFHVDSLAMLGIGADRLVTFDVRDDQESPRSWKLERLWFSPGPIGPTPSPKALAWLRTAALDSLDAEPAPPHRLVYTSRRRTRYRRIVNEDEVSEYLVGRGFEVHVPEDYTLREQITLFAEAKVVLGAHGAAHANTIFSRPGLVLVAIQNSDVDKFFHNMSLALGNEYCYMLGDDVPNGSDINDDIFVPLDKLERITSLALSARRA